MLETFETEIPQLIEGEERRIYVYTPDKRGNYPVLYLFDGQNLFDDEEATYGKSWGLFDYLKENKVPLIVVGVECNHHGEEEKCGGRLSEYTPFPFEDPHWGKIKARGKITMDFFVNELKPYIDDNYPTKPDRKHTFIAGSSMGGLMTLYALCRYNDVFSRGASLSPSLTFAPEKVLSMIRNGRMKSDTVLYMDYGEKEFYGRSRQAFADATAALIRKKIRVTSRIAPNGEHNEASWEKAVPFFMDILFYEG